MTVSSTVCVSRGSLRIYGSLPAYIRIPQTPCIYTASEGCVYTQGSAYIRRLPAYIRRVPIRKKHE